MLSLAGGAASSVRAGLPARPVGGCLGCPARHLSVCAAMAGDELGDLEALSQPVHLESRQSLFRQGDPADAVYNLTEGMVGLSRLLPDGRRHVMGFAMAGDFLGLALPERYGVTVEALAPTGLCRFERRAFGDLLGRKPHFLRRLHERAGYELTLAQDHMLLLGRRTAEEKLVSFLISLRDRYARIGQSAVTIALPMGRQDIADHLGLTIETVSRLMTRLDREKAVLIVPGGVRLLDTGRLDDLAAA